MQHTINARRFAIDKISFIPDITMDEMQKIKDCFYFYNRTEHSRIRYLVFDIFLILADNALKLIGYSYWERTLRMLENSHENFQAAEELSLLFGVYNGTIPSMETIPAYEETADTQLLDLTQGSFRQRLSGIKRLASMAGQTLPNNFIQKLVLGTNKDNIYTNLFYRKEKAFAEFIETILAHFTDADLLATKDLSSMIILDMYYIFLDITSDKKAAIDEIIELFGNYPIKEINRCKFSLKSRKTKTS